MLGLGEIVWCSDCVRVCAGCRRRRADQGEEETGGGHPGQVRYQERSPRVRFWGQYWLCVTLSRLSMNINNSWLIRK